MKYIFVAGAPGSNGAEYEQNYVTSDVRVMVI